MVFVVGISPRRRAGNLFFGVLGAFYECLFLFSQRLISYPSPLSIGCAVSKQDPLLADIFPRCRTLFAQLRDGVFTIYCFSVVSSGSRQTHLPRADSFGRLRISSIDCLRGSPSLRRRAGQQRGLGSRRNDLAD